jgi:hypothetical protein
MHSWCKSIFIASQVISTLMIILAFYIFVLNISKVVAFDTYRLIVLLLLASLVATLYGVSYAIKDKINYNEMFENMVPDTFPLKKTLEEFNNLSDDDRKSALKLFYSIIKI